MLHLGAFASAYFGFALLALGQARHAETVAAAPPRPRRMLAASLLALSLVLAIQREGWGFGLLAWATHVTIAALTVVATLTWRPGWLRPLASPILSRKAEPMPRRFLLAMPLLLTPFAALAQVSGGGGAMLPHDLSPWGMVANADWVVQSVMAGLVLASVLTWTIALAKGVALFAASRRTRAGLAALHAAKSLDEAGRQLGPAHGLCAALIRAAQEEVTASAGAMNKEGVKERAASRLERLVAGAGRSMGRGAGVLATIGATAPFVGLFGTVWGIMNSFIGISRAQTTNLAVVAPGIAEALLATAIGLIAAIPAVVIYNVFARAIAGHKVSLADAAGATMRLLSRDLDRGQPGRLRAVGE